MKAYQPPLICLIMFLCVSVSANELKFIQLVDGSKLRAEVVSLNNDIYTLRSAALGEIEIPADNVDSISATAPTDRTASTASTTTGPVLDNVRRSLIENPETMGKINQLQNDPMVQEIINDPVTMRAISSGDLSALMNNPKIKALMGNPTVRDLTQSADF
ncbi:MAG: hypothetical protein O3C28_18945 [Proteobacteria bacterium]|nr:hypothetical protein [Pseudomonadota bacterium]